MVDSNGNYWSVSGFTNPYFDNVIGVFSTTDGTGKQLNFFWHHFSSNQANNLANSEINIQYQMGDSNSNWEGVYIAGTATGKPMTTVNLSPRSITNDGWNPATP